MGPNALIRLRVLGIIVIRSVAIFVIDCALTPISPGSSWENVYMGLMRRVDFLSILRQNL